MLESEGDSYTIRLNMDLSVTVDAEIALDRRSNSIVFLSGKISGQNPVAVESMYQKISGTSLKVIKDTIRRQMTSEFLKSAAEMRGSSSYPDIGSEIRGPMLRDIMEWYDMMEKSKNLQRYPSSDIIAAIKNAFAPSDSLSSVGYLIEPALCSSPMFRLWSTFYTPQEMEEKLKRSLAHTQFEKIEAQEEGSVLLVWRKR